jgi:hypothetical protein
MLFREVIAVYCENHTKVEINSVGLMQSFSMLKQVICTRVKHKLHYTITEFLT